MIRITSVFLSVLLCVPCFAGNNKKQCAPFAYHEQQKLRTQIEQQLQPIAINVNPDASTMAVIIFLAALFYVHNHNETEG